MATQLEPATGSFDDVSRSLKAVIRSSRNLGENTLDFVARELAMAVKLSEQLRDEAISADLIAEARANPVAASFRESAHRAVDVAADLGSVGYVLVLRAVNTFTGEGKKKINPLAP